MSDALWLLLGMCAGGVTCAFGLWLYVILTWRPW